MILSRRDASRILARRGAGAYATHELIYTSDIVDGQVKNADLGDGAVTRSSCGPNVHLVEDARERRFL